MTDRTLFRASAVALIAAAMAGAPALAATGSPAAAAPAPTTGSMSAAPSASPQTIARAGKALHQVLEIKGMSRPMLNFGAVHCLVSDYATFAG